MGIVMNTKVLFFSPILTAVLLLATAVLIPANKVMAEVGQFNQRQLYLSRDRFKSNKFSGSTRQHSQSSQYQRTTIDLDASELGQLHLLDISAAPGVRLSGQVIVDGIVIQELSSNRVSISLSPYLRGGRKTVEILGRYQPARASVQVEFSSPNTTITQQTSGTGLLRHVFVFNMQ